MQLWHFDAFCTVPSISRRNVLLRRLEISAPHANFLPQCKVSSFMGVLPWPRCCYGIIVVICSIFRYLSYTKTINPKPETTQTERVRSLCWFWFQAWLSRLTGLPDGSCRWRAFKLNLQGVVTIERRLTHGLTKGIKGSYITRNCRPIFGWRWPRTLFAFPSITTNWSSR